MDHLSQGRAYAENGEWEKAVAAFEQALHEDPDRVEAYDEQGMALYRSGHHERSYQVYETMKQRGLRPQSPFFLLALSSHLESRDCLEEAVEVYRDLVEVSDYAEQKLQLADVLFRLRRFEETVPLLEEIVEEKPGLARAHAELACARRAMGLRDQAETPPDESDADTCFEWGYALLVIGCDDEAFELFHKALEKDPYHMDAHMEVANLELKRENFAEAQRRYDWIRQTNPLNDIAFAKNAYSLLRLGRTEEARESVQEALRLAPDRDAYHELLSAIESTA